MWTFTRDGFFSVTTDTRTNGENVMVRARVREDLERLVKRIEPRFTLQAEILESKRADYRYRILIPRWLWTEYLGMVVDDIDYTNVKDTLAPMKTDPERHKAMMRCWSAMYDLQPGGRPWGPLDLALSDSAWDTWDDEDDDWEAEV